MKINYMWQANITIQNNTEYNLTVDGVEPGNTTIGSNYETQWSSQYLSKVFMKYERAHNKNN